MPNIVYVLTNPAMPGIVKIGMTDRDVQSRMKQLYDTGVPLPFECVIARQLEDRRAEEIEGALHTAFRPYRVNPSREFFELDPEQARALLQVMPGTDVTPGGLPDDAGLPIEDREAASEFKRRQERMSEEDFLWSLDSNGLPVFQRVLALGKQEGMRIRWGKLAFSMYVESNGDSAILCRGYPLGNQPPAESPVFNQAIYTDFARLEQKAGVSADVIAPLRQQALDTGLFVPVGGAAELRCTIDRKLTEDQIDALVGSLGAIAQRIREPVPGYGKNDDSEG